MSQAEPSVEPLDDNAVQLHAFGQRHAHRVAMLRPHREGGQGLVSVAVFLRRKTAQGGDEHCWESLRAPELSYGFFRRGDTETAT